MDLIKIAPPTLKHGFWPQSRVNVLPLEVGLLGNEVFNEDDQYVGLGSNCPPPSFRVGVNCYEQIICSFCVLEMRHKLNMSGGKSFVSIKFCNFWSSFSTNSLFIA